MLMQETLSVGGIGTLGIFFVDVSGRDARLAYTPSMAQIHLVVHTSGGLAQYQSRSLSY